MSDRIDAGGAAAVAAGPSLDKPAVDDGKPLGRLMASPLITLLVFIFTFPSFMLIYLSVTWWTPLDGDWIYAYESLNWFYNFGEVFEDERLWQSIWRTFVIIIIAVPVEFILGLALANLFVDSFPGKRVFYAILLMPMMVVPAVSGYMFFMLFQAVGPINLAIASIIGQPVEIDWLGQSDLALFTIILADIWQWTPLMFLILLAGLLGVPQDQMNAATLLGAGWVQKFVRIVLPKMRTIMIIAIIIRVVEAFKLFDVMYVMTKGGPGVATETISVYMYKQTFANLEWSYVAAVGLVLVIVLSLLALVGLNLMTKRSGGRSPPEPLQSR